MININKYILEKLHLNKDTKAPRTKEKIDEEFIKKISQYVKGIIGIELGSSYDAQIKAKEKYLFLTLPKTRRYDRKAVYSQIMQYINDNLDVSKNCSTNNSDVYIYPKYE